MPSTHTGHPAPSIPQGEPPRRPAYLRVVGVAGRILVAGGLLLLFYAVYLLWGTGVYTQQAQEDLSRRIAADPVVSQGQVGEGEVPAARPAEEPAAGDPLFTMQIPEVGLETVIVQGVGREELKKGPGHFPEAPYPGEGGNVSVSGHRTTYGAPFFRLDELEPGDPITIESGPARYRYRVRETLVVDPTDVWVVEQQGRDELTLTTCHPRFSAAERLIVKADYVGADWASPVEGAGPPEAGGASEAPPARGETGEDAEAIPASSAVVPTDVVALGAVALAAALGALALSERRRWLAARATVVLGAGALLWVAVFPQLLRLMPANY